MAGDLVQRRLLLRPGTPLRRFGGEGVLVLQEKGEVLVLNDAACRVLELARDGATVAEIVDRLGEELAVSRERLERDVLAFVAQLIGEALVDVAAGAEVSEP